MKKLIALHKHWVTADAIKEAVDAAAEPNTSLPDGLYELAKIHSSFARLSVLYGLIFVVIEGYRELNYSDNQIDFLLSNEEYVDALRRFRNATFHYQKEPISDKLLPFLELQDSELWIKNLHNAFRSFFENSLPIKQIIDKLQEL